MIKTVIDYLEEHKDKSYIFERNGIGYTVTTLYYTESQNGLDLYLKSIDGSVLHEQLINHCVNIEKKELLELLKRKTHKPGSNKLIYTYVTLEKNAILIEDVFLNSFKRLATILEEGKSEHLI